MVERQDSRKVRSTKKLLKDSLIELMKTYPMSKITVKMISEKAGVNRGTFYTYYHDSYELLEATENELYEAIYQNLSLAGRNYQIIMLQIFGEIERNRKLCSVLFSENGDKAFVKRVLSIAHDQTIEEWSAMYPGREPQIYEMAYNYQVSGTIGLLADWITDDCGMKPELMVQFIINFWYKGLESLLIKAEMPEHHTVF